MDKTSSAIFSENIVHFLFYNTILELKKFMFLSFGI